MLIRSAIKVEDSAIGPIKLDVWYFTNAHIIQTNTMHNASVFLTIKASWLAEDDSVFPKTWSKKVALGRKSVKMESRHALELDIHDTAEEKFSSIFILTVTSYLACQ